MYQGFSMKLFSSLQTYSVKKIEGKETNNATMYMTLSFAGVALMAAMIVGAVVMKKRNGRHPHHQVKSLTHIYPFVCLLTFAPKLLST